MTTATTLTRTQYRRLVLRWILMAALVPMLAVLNAGTAPLVIMSVSIIGGLGAALYLPKMIAIREDDAEAWWRVVLVVIRDGLAVVGAVHIVTMLL